VRVRLWRQRNRKVEVQLAVRRLEDSRDRGVDGYAEDRRAAGSEPREKELTCLVIVRVDSAGITSAAGLVMEDQVEDRQSAELKRRVENGPVVAVRMYWPASMSVGALGRLPAPA
jgi:hypothetical protein